MAAMNARHAMESKARTAGFTLVELLIAAFMLTVVLGIVGTFLASQSNLSRRTQAGSEVKDKVRMVMQLVTTDLNMAGASSYVDSTGSTTILLNTCPTFSGTQGCLVGWNGASGSEAKDEFAAAYVTTLRDVGQACRKVSYRFDGGDLERSDTACADAAAYSVLATNVDALNIVYRCSNGNTMVAVPDTTACPKGTSYPRSAVVSVVAHSDVPIKATPQRTYDIVSGVTSPATLQVTCGPDAVCSSQTQEILFPNLKDR